MLVLLPPSEQKADGGAGPPWGPGDPTLSTPALAPTRSRVIDALETVVTGDEEKAAEALRLPPATVAEALEANRRVRTSPTVPALDRYTGVLYAALDVPTLPADARTRAEAAVCVFSGLLGLVRGGDLVPSYRVPASADLPGLGVLARVWRPVLRDAVPRLLGRDGFAVDLRSSDYAAMWTPTGPLRAQVLPVRILRRRGRGRTATERVVSYHSKVAKGRLVRALVEREAPVRSYEEVAEVACALGWDAGPRWGTGGSVALDLVDATGSVGSRDGPVGP